MRYQLLKDTRGNSLLGFADDGKVYGIPFDSANTDYANFKRQINEGAELQDADGNTMTAEQARDFVKELP